jgi:hypothetical protein
MKKSGFILGVPAMALVLASVFAACATLNSPGTAPTLTIVVSGSYDDSTGQTTPQTAFAIDEGITFRFEGTDPDKNVKKSVILIKKDGRMVNNPRESEISPRTNPFLYNVGSWTFSDPGAYTAEVYVVDSKGNQSNTLTADFTVN